VVLGVESVTGACADSSKWKESADFNTSGFKIDPER
jgi:hypothetical protein